MQTFGLGSRGYLIKEYQQALERAAGAKLLRGVDGKFGKETANLTVALARATQTDYPKVYAQLQQERALFGQAGPQMWRVVGIEWPELFARCLQLTAAFEGTGFGGACGPAQTGDSAGVTFGLVGFTSYNGELQGLLRKARATDPDDFEQVGCAALGVVSYNVMLKLIDERAERREFERWALRDGSVVLSVKAWLASLADLDWFKRLEMQEAFSRYWTIAKKQTDLLFVGATPRAYALMFDIAVQNGGLKSGEAGYLADLFSSGRYDTELDRMHMLHTTLIARLRDASRPTRIIEDVRSRKGTIIVGSGRVHGETWTVKRWAL